MMASLPYSILDQKPRSNLAQKRKVNLNYFGLRLIVVSCYVLFVNGVSKWRTRRCCETEQYERRAIDQECNTLWVSIVVQGR